MFVILFSALYIYCADVRLENKRELTQQSLSIALQSEFLHLASARLHDARSQNVVPKASVCYKWVERTSTVLTFFKKNLIIIGSDLLIFL